MFPLLLKWFFCVSMKNLRRFPSSSNFEVQNYTLSPYSSLLGFQLLFSLWYPWRLSHVCAVWRLDKHLKEISHAKLGPYGFLFYLKFLFLISNDSCSSKLLFLVPQVKTKPNQNNLCLALQVLATPCYGVPSWNKLYKHM